MHNIYTIKEDNLLLSVTIKTNAKQNKIISLLDNKFKIALNAKPIQGKANLVLIKFLANTLNIPQNQIIIFRGETSSIKIIKLPLSVKIQIDQIIEALSLSCH